MKKVIVLKTKGFDWNSYEIFDVLREEETVYEFAKKYMDCMLENVCPAGLPEPYVMIVDEEGLLKGLSVNYIATALYNAETFPIITSPIVGNAIIVKEVSTDDGMDWGFLDDYDIERIIGKQK